MPIRLVDQAIAAGLQPLLLAEGFENRTRRREKGDPITYARQCADGEQLVEVVAPPSSDSISGKFEVILSIEFSEATRVLNEACDGRWSAFIYTRLYPEPNHSHFYYYASYLCFLFGFKGVAVVGAEVAETYRLQGTAWFETEASWAAYREKLRDDDRHRRGVPGLTPIAAALVEGDRELAEDRLHRLLQQDWARRVLTSDAKLLAERYGLRMPEL
jgi:hypothetical protein